MDILRHWLCLAAVFAMFSTFSLLAQGPPTAQIGFPGSFTGTFTFLNNIDGTGLDLDQNGTADVGMPCSCRILSNQASGAGSATEVFDSWLIIATGISGQSWQIEYSHGAQEPTSLQSLTAGTLIPEIGQSGIYVLHFAHLSGVEFAIQIFNPTEYPGQHFGPFIQTCRYPQPQIHYLDDYYCGNEAPSLLYGSASTIANSQFYPIDPVEESWQITHLGSGQSYATALFDPANLGGGNYRVDYTFHAGDSAYFAPHQTGCSATVSAFTSVRGPGSLACHSALNVALHPQTCSASLSQAMLALGASTTWQGLRLEVLTENGVSLGHQITAEYAGRTLLGVLTDSCSGDYCTTLLHIKDYHPPSVMPPANRSISCTDSTDPSHTGYPVVLDCSIWTMEFQDQEEYFPCGNPVSRIYRTWRVTDSFGQTTSRTQTIEIQRGALSQLRFPSNLDITCQNYAADPTLANPETGKAGIPTLVDTPLCGMQFTFEDDTIPYCGPASFVILRTWTVIDACGFQIFTTDGAGNSNIQFIRITDQSSPEIASLTLSMTVNAGPMETGLSECSAHGFVAAPTVTDACSNVNLRVFSTTGELTSFSGGQIGALVPYPGLPIGTHHLRFEAEDDCGNRTVRELPLQVRDEMPPVMACRGQIQLALTQDGLGIITPNMIDVASRDDCCAGQKWLKLAHEPDSAFRPFIELACPDTSSLSVEMRMSDCHGNENVCSATVNIQTPSGACPTFSTLSGRVTTETMAPIHGAQLILEGGIHAVEVSSPDGHFEFADLPGEPAYTLRAERPGSHGNGVSIFDLVLISRHILGIQPLGSPYKIIAADVNRSGTITTLDMVLIRRVILGLDQEFSQNSAWRFVPADFDFPEPSNPFAGSGFPEWFVFPELKRDTVVKFIGIKTGDVNGTAIIQD